MGYHILRLQFMQMEWDREILAPIEYMYRASNERAERKYLKKLCNTTVFCTLISPIKPTQIVTLRRLF